MLRAVLFDWGETLFYSKGGAEVLIRAGVPDERAQQLWAEVWAATKTPEALARRRDLSASAHRAAWEILLAPVEAEVPGFAETLYESVRDPASWLPYPDVPSVLRSLRQAQVRVGVVSNIAFPLRPAFESTVWLTMSTSSPSRYGSASRSQIRRSS
jgi:FMN phosphatase YigB (HAD superfamily)